MTEGWLDYNAIERIAIETFQEMGGELVDDKLPAGSIIVHCPETVTGQGTKTPRDIKLLLILAAEYAVTRKPEEVHIVNFVYPRTKVAYTALTPDGLKFLSAVAGKVSLARPRLPLPRLRSLPPPLLCAVVGRAAARLPHQVAQEEVGPGGAGRGRDAQPGGRGPLQRRRPAWRARAQGGQRARPGGRCGARGDRRADLRAGRQGADQEPQLGAQGVARGSQPGARAPTPYPARARA